MSLFHGNKNAVVQLLLHEKLAGNLSTLSSRFAVSGYPISI
jgi:hypothetical protein